MATPALSDLIFSEQANHNFSRILGDLKRANLSITNRLRSIRQDAQFVEQVAITCRLPLVANERCGSWYVDPELKAASAYFKSTDGHTGQWKFSTRRLNLHLLELIGRQHGCIIVDSTRRGKSMPDALSKTVPVWCCVLNRALFPDNPGCHNLRVPPDVVSDSEKSQMEARIPEFLESFRLLDIDVASLRGQLGKPLRPVWRTPDNPYLEPASPDLASFYPVVCCTSSSKVVGTEMSEAGYIQGAGDDTENWALGLTAPMFWAHADKLLCTSEAGLPEVIASLVASADAEKSGDGDIRQLTPYISVCPLPISPNAVSPNMCFISIIPAATEESSWVKSNSELVIGVGKHKLASRNLRQALPVICDFVSQFLDSKRTDLEGETNVLIGCDSGRDLSVGVALAVDCWCFLDNGELRPRGEAVTFTKNSIRLRLGRIMTAMPEANPNRATLQSVNSFLMDWRQ